MGSAIPSSFCSHRYFLTCRDTICRADMFVAASNGMLKHFTMISTNFTRNSRMWGRLSSTAASRMAEVLDVLDGKQDNGWSSV
jgi:hypothetical protein